MKAIKVLGIIILLLIATLTIIPLFLADNVTISSEKVINAKPATVFQQVNMLKNWKHWSPFEDDSTMIDIYEGPEAGLGAKRIWSGEKAGEGSLTILKSEPYALIQNKLEFGPDGAGGTGTWNLEEIEEGVKLSPPNTIAQNQLPVASHAQSINSKIPPPIMILNNHDFSLSKMNVFGLVLLNPKRSSITNVEYT